MWSRSFLTAFLLLGWVPMLEAKPRVDAWQSTAERKKVGRILAEMDRVIAKGPFRDTWASLRGYRIPEWFQDAKFGIFIHWGVYSVPSFDSEWYSRHMYEQGHRAFEHHVRTYGPQAEFGYKDFIPRFKAKKFDPAHWAGVFKASGARYVVPVAEHHDGFMMYDSRLSRWTAKRMGPKKDILGLLFREFGKAGLIQGASSHRAEHWWFMNGGMKFDSDVQDPKFADFYGPAVADETPPDPEYLSNWLARTCELVDRYKPRVLYFDWWIGEKPQFEPYVRKFMAYYYNRAAQWGFEPVLLTKDKAHVPGTSVMDMERGKLTDIRREYWQTDTSISWGSWCYIENDHYKDAPYLVRYLVDAVSKNANLLLNIGPKPDGTLPEKGKEALQGMGKWLGIHGDAIYGTRPWKSFGEGPTEDRGGKFSEGGKYKEGDVRFTWKGDLVNVIALMPPTKPLTVASLGEAASPNLKVKDVTRMGSLDPVRWKRGPKGLVLPAAPRKDGFPVVYQVQVTGSARGGLELKSEGKRLSASTYVQNYGGDDLSLTAKLLIDGKKVSAQIVQVPPGSSRDVTLTFVGKKPAIHQVSLVIDRHRPLKGTAALPVLDLEGEWAFHKGDDDSWSEPGLKEKDWEKVHLPAAWEDHSGYLEDNVYGWYRKRIVVPAEWKGHDLVLPLGRIDDADVAFFNGTRIGSTGSFPPKFEGKWSEERRYRVPAQLVRWGKENVIAVKVFDAYGGGGIYDGPLGPMEVK